MNPAALKANIKDLPRGADIIVNTDEFTTRNLTKVGYAANPLEDGSLESYARAPDPAHLDDRRGAQGHSTSRKKDAERAKNMFALGLLSWLYHRPTEGTVTFLRQKFAKKPEILAANITAFEAGWSFGETTEDFSVQYEIKPAADGARALPQHLRQPGAGLRPRRRLAARRAAALPRLLPDHAGLGHPARAEQAQAVRRA